MKIIKYIAILFLFSGGLTSCRCNKEIITNETIRIEKEIVRDTIFKIVADSSSFHGRLKCDSLGNIIIVQASFTSGKSLKAPKLSIKDNILQVDCRVEAQKLFFQWKEKYKSDRTSATKEIQVEKQLSTWQIVQIWLGRILILLLILALVALYVQHRHKFATK